MTDDINNDRLLSPSEKPDDQGVDLSLRPKELKDFVGQEKIKDNLNIFITAAKKRQEPLEHVLLYGPPGLGKTTLAHIIANEMGSNIKVTTGPAIEKSGDLAAILTNLQPGDILFIDEIHRLNRVIEEVLYPAMEDYALDLVIGKGPSARTLRLDLPKFTIIGATTKLSRLSAPLRDRFGNVFRLDFYEHADIEKILNRSARILNVEMAATSAPLIATRARRTPRIANRLLKRVRDYAEVKNNGVVDEKIIEEALGLLNIDELGLDEIDRLLLRVIHEKFAGGPVGLNSLAASLGEEIDTIEDVIEPYLLQLGFINRTPRGRIIGDRALEHLKLKKNNDLNKLL